MPAQEQRRPLSDSDKARASRLRQALGKRSIRWLAARLAERGGEGDRASYSSVSGYVKGGRIAPAQFLEAAADILDVRFTWLAAGEGEMTRVEAPAGAHAAPAELGLNVYGAIRRAIPELQEVSEEVSGLLYSLVARCMPYMKRKQFTEAFFAELALRIWEGLKVPARVFGQQDPRQYLDAWDYSNYMAAMIHAFSLAIPNPEQPEAAPAKNRSDRGRLGGVHPPRPPQGREKRLSVGDQRRGRKAPRG